MRGGKPAGNVTAGVPREDDHDARDSHPPSRSCLCCTPEYKHIFKSVWRGTKKILKVLARAGVRALVKVASRKTHMSDKTADVIEEVASEAIDGVIDAIGDEEGEGVEQRNRIMRREG